MELSLVGHRSFGRHIKKMDVEIKNAREIVVQLDEAVPNENAKIEMKVIGGGPDESQIVGTENGFLRLGI